MPDPISFAAASPRLGLPYLFAAQTQKEFFVNEALARVDSLLHGAIEGSAETPPAMPAEGECWLVGSTPTDAWLGHAGELACHQSGNWLFVSPRDGLRVLDRESGQLVLYRNGWQRPAAPASPSGGATVDAEARAAIDALLALLREAGVLPAS